MEPGRNFKRGLIDNVDGGQMCITVIAVSIKRSFVVAGRRGKLLRENNRYPFAYTRVFNFSKWSGRFSTIRINVDYKKRSASNAYTKIGTENEAIITRSFVEFHRNISYPFYTRVFNFSEWFGRFSTIKINVDCKKPSTSNAYTKIGIK